MNLRDHIQAVYDQVGTLTPELVVSAARPKDHPLHDRFEWDNRIAGEAYRRQQAHDLIQAVHVVRQTEGDDPIRVRAFHAVRSEQGHVFEPVDKVMANPLMRQMVLMDMEREWRSMKARFDTFEEFWRLVRAEATSAA